MSVVYCYQILLESNHVLLTCEFVDVTGGEFNRVCSHASTMTSRNLNDAKEECKRNPSCRMFYDVCGYGNKFKFCSYTSSKESSCGSMLFRNGKSIEYTICCW